MIRKEHTHSSACGSRWIRGDCRQRHLSRPELVRARARRRARAAFSWSFNILSKSPVSKCILAKGSTQRSSQETGQPELDAFEFLTLIKAKMKLMQMDESFLNRGVNEGFSGGEKKRNEILQMAVLEPKLALLDETASGLDIDALRVVASGVNSLRDASRAIVMVTHYPRLLDYIEPDFVHVLSNGTIIKSGDKQLAKELEKRGYDWVKQEAAA